MIWAGVGVSAPTPLIRATRWLEALLSAEVDFEALRADPPVRLLIAATAVSNGRLQIFRETELSRDMVLASMCLPMLSQAVQIEGERYWDGGTRLTRP